MDGISWYCTFFPLKVIHLVVRVGYPAGPFWVWKCTCTAVFYGFPNVAARYRNFETRAAISACTTLTRIEPRMQAHSVRSGSSSSAPRQQPAFHRVFIYIPTFKPFSKPVRAWLSISTSIRWIEVKSENESPPENFLSFRGPHCLVLERVSTADSWKYGT